MLKIDLDVLDVRFNAIPNPEERAYCTNLPKSFALRADAVDQLRDVAGHLISLTRHFREARILSGTDLPAFTTFLASADRHSASVLVES